jgi:hypothetical protein
MVTSPNGTRPSRWFRSSDPEQQHPVHGTYEILSNGQPELRLHSSWDPHTHPEFERSSSEFKLLHGDVFGTATTAVGNAYRSGSFSMNELMDYRIHPKYTLEGLWLSEDELTFTNARVQLWDQDSWTGWSGHTVNRSPNGHISSIMIQPDRTYMTEHKGVAIRLVCTSSSQTTYGADVSIQSQSRFELDFPEPVSMEQLLTDWLKPLEILVVSATGQLSGLSAVRLTNTHWKSEADHEDPPDSWVKMRTSFASRAADNDQRILTKHSLSDFDFGLQLPKIFDAVPQFEFSLDQYLSLVSHRAGGDLVRCTTAVQMVESLDRVLHHPDVTAQGDSDIANQANEALKNAGIGNSKLRRDVRKFLRDRENPTLEDRLRRLDQDLSNPISSLLNRNTWPRHVARVRNIVAHGLDESVVLTTDIRATRVATLICTMLFEAHWLKALGFDNDRIRMKVGADGLRLAVIEGNYKSMEDLSDLRTAATAEPEDFDS